MRTLLLAILTALTTSCVTIEPQCDRSVGPFTQLVGTWAPLVDNKRDCTNAQTISFSSDLSVATFRITKPFKDSDGKEISSVTYKVLSVDGNAITMFLNGEKRRTSNGAPVVWTLVAIEENAYVWRQTDWSPGQSTVPYLRCERFEDRLGGGAS